MLDSDGRLVGGTVTNVHAVIDDKLCTPGDRAYPGEVKAASALFVSHALIGI